MQACIDPLGTTKKNHACSYYFLLAPVDFISFSIISHVLLKTQNIMILTMIIIAIIMIVVIIIVIMIRRNKTHDFYF